MGGRPTSSADRPPIHHLLNPAPTPPPSADRPKQQVALRGGQTFLRLRRGAASSTRVAPTGRRGTWCLSRARRTAVCVRSVSSAICRKDNPDS